MKNVQHDVQVPLPEELYRQLRVEAERVNQPAKTLARDAIAEWPQRRRNVALHDSIRTYAELHAGTPADLDEDLEQAAMERLMAKERDG